MKYQLSNGIRVVYDYMPWIKSVTIGIWIKAGSRNESTDINGVSHFIEHMLFKGTTNRSAKQIANEIDFIGGNINAFTSKEYTCYYTKTLDEDLYTAVDVLSDILLNSVFDSKDIDKEKSVILEEISMYEDSPEDLVYEIMSKGIWSSSLGYPVAGTKESVSSLDREKIVKYKEELYTPANIVVSVAGNFEKEKLFSTLEAKLSSLKNPNGEASFEEEKYIKNYSFRKKDIEQSNVCLALPAYGYGDDRQYPLMIVNNMFGGSMSSILFQKIREEKGLCYTIYSSTAPHAGFGTVFVYAATNPSQTEQLIDGVYKQIKELHNIHLTEEDLKKNKQQLKGNLLLSYESTSTRMTSMGKAEILQKKIVTQDEILNKLEQVTIDKVIHSISEIFKPDALSLAVVANFENDSFIKKLYEGFQ